MWRLLILISAIAWAQPPVAFPSDVQNPQSAGGSALLEAVCPGHVVAEKEISCNTPCPSFAGLPELAPWRLVGVLLGSFLSPNSDDAVLAMGGCEAHALGFGGAVMLTRDSGQWKMLWYKAGIPMDKCHKVRQTTGREILVCLGFYGAAGVETTALMVEDLTQPTVLSWDEKDAGNRIVDVFDNSFTCGENFNDLSKPLPIRREYLESVEFQQGSGGRLRRLRVRGRMGKRAMTPQDVEACNRDMAVRRLSFVPPTKPFRAEFTFDGIGFKRVAAK